MPDAPHTTTTSQPLPDGEVLRFTGDVNFSNSPALRQELLTRISKKPKRLVLDMAGVGYMDSAGVATFVEALRNQRAHGGKLVMCNLQDRVMGMFKIARLNTVFDIAQSEEAARTV
ncbi:MAG: anti-sigma factor antagonist [Phycisphaera sp.]|nr:anti-sigma factor antagonist [Phycisphaera sp.]